ncbi:hypothetical protein NMG60_11007949 [Bertholletia excelsa]
MGVFEFDNVKAEKAKAIRRFNRLQTLAKLFRLAEICLGLVLLSWISAWLPFAVRISGEYFRRLIAVAVSPLFIFVLGNAIVVTLLAKSGLFSGKNPAVDHAETDLYEELVKSSGKEFDYGYENCSPSSESEVLYQDKEIISEASTVARKVDEVENATDTVPDKKSFQRTQSENLTRENLERPFAKLRRSQTEKCRKSMDSDEVPPETGYLVDELSNEEFQRTVEEFIAKQVKFHQAEKLAIVTC